MTPVSHDAPSPPSSGRTDTLALLLQGVFTAIVRIQSGRQTMRDAEAFRGRMRSALKEAERDARGARYSNDDFSDAQFAVVALLDEAILSSKEAAKEEWRKRTLSVELYKEANAGDVFFDKLDGKENALMRRGDSLPLAEVLEVYLLCLLLGFEGKMGGERRGESLELASRMRQRIEQIRGLDYRVSPPLELKPMPKPAPEPKNRYGEWLRWGAIGLAGVVLLFLIYKLHLSWRLGQLQEIVSR